MPSFQDSVVIFFIALLIFGPKKLPELARQLGKLMGEFRRASNEFRMQMEDELRISEQAEQKKKIDAMEAAAPPLTPALTEGTEGVENTIAPIIAADPIEIPPHALAPAEFPPLPIATSGDLALMPPSTGLPVSSTSLSEAFDSIPQETDPMAAVSSFPPPNMSAEVSTDHLAAEQIPDRAAQRTASSATTGRSAGTTTGVEAEPATEASLHG